VEVHCETVDHTEYCELDCTDLLHYQLPLQCDMTDIHDLHGQYKLCMSDWEGEGGTGTPRENILLCSDLF